MPTLPTNTKCASLGCKEPRSKFNSYCITHGGKDWDDREERLKGNAFYQSAHWKVMRRNQLSREPLCASCLCQGLVTQAKHVDHVFAWQKINTAAFYINLFQSLCVNCHSYKTGKEQKGLYLHYKKNEVLTYTKLDYECVVANASLET